MFYKIDKDGNQYSGRAIHGPGYTLTPANRGQDPVDGWQWFDSEADAIAQLGWVSDPEKALRALDVLRGTNLDAQTSRGKTVRELVAEMVEPRVER